MNRRRWICSIAAFLLLAGTSTGCNMDIFHDAISTRMEIPYTESGERVMETKRFRFERDIQGTKLATLERAWASVEAPEGFDLSFLSTVDVYGIDPATSARIHLLHGDQFKPGKTTQDLEIVFPGDVRPFVQDQRVTMDWEIQPNVMYRGWAENAPADVSFGIILEIQTE